ncbi:homocysteine-inducible, endoplasmic reticulum stress-inducible, ubiquitin-like domain member 1 [Columba livia]|uniref:Homocysteine-inducible, endoplasmic reticulum stress-inducible, ubiquitin-like domain member 1 n=1 Tax=Columba livia TaxID=8932 RepID=A0A2I0LPL0_COLLI|nr:homocysteine-responsive endoplasmic reticulum-resident ubiquitin-like domain member 1 protein [Columba livia]PKK19376.1 homocysteine-inducible, endoplasmic reticulum stress-inducible, ubiquitin-like domain member 1 [Columba livia]
MAEALALLVRSPTQRHPDLRLRGDPGWTVRRLKSELRRLVPDAPPEEEQKLIYSGKLLLDHHYLRELLPKDGELHALHLVYNFKSPANTQETSAEVKADPPKLSSAASQEPSVSSSNGERLRCSSGGQSLAEASHGLETTRHPFQSVAPGFSMYTTYSMLQMSWYQQIYARQYYMQYLASAAASADPSHARRSQEIPVAPVTPPAPLPDPFPAQNQPRNQNAAAQVNAVANQNMQMNAQGGPLMEEEEGGGNRDWLDWLYSATLFYVFVNIIYFYSSVSRFLLVMGGTVLMYLHHVGWFPFRRRLGQPLPGNVPSQAAGNQDQNNNLQGENVGRDESRASPDEGQVLQELHQANPSFMSTVWIFFKTFFASLLPEGPGVTRN